MQSEPKGPALGTFGATMFTITPRLGKGFELRSGILPEPLWTRTGLSAEKHPVDPGVSPQLRMK